MSVALIGREQELAAAAAALDVCRTNGSAAVSVAGEPGIGKSAFLDAVLTVAPPAEVFRLAGFHPARSVPLSAATEFLRRLMTTGPQGATLARVLDADDERALQPFRVLEAVRAALLPLAPVLLVIDDVQWADDLSLALVHHVARSARQDDVPVGVVWAARPGERLEQFAHGFRDGSDAFVELTMRPLDEIAGATLARALDPTLSAEAAAELASVAAGSPFWISSLVRRGTVAGAVPASAADVIKARLDGLSGDDAELFAALVVAARPVSSDGLSAMTEWPPGRVKSAAAGLVDRGLVRTVSGEWVVVHDLVREAAYQDIPADGQRRWHRRVAAWLRSTGDDDLSVLMEALAHWDRAGSPPLDLALEIVTSPKRRLLGVEGLRRLAAIADAVGGDGTVADDLQVAVAELAAELGEREDAYRRWARLADHLPTPEGRSRAALAAAQQAIDLVRSDDAARMLARVRESGAADEWLAVAADALDHTRRLWVDHDGPGARSLLDRAVTTARRLASEAGGVDRLRDHQRQAYVQVMSSAWDAALVEDDLAGMAAAVEARLAGTRGRGPTEEHLIAQAEAAHLHEWYGRDGAAFEQMAVVLAEARQQVYPALVADLCQFLAYTAYNLGRLTDALELLDEADAIEARLPGRTRRMVPWICGSLRPVIEASSSDWRSAVEELQSRSAAEPNPHLRLRLRQWTSRVASRYAGNDARRFVVDETDAALSDAEAAGCARCKWSVVLSSALHRLLVGAPDSARSLHDSWLATHSATEKRFALYEMWIDALLAAADGASEVPARFEAVVELAHRRGNRLYEVWALMDLGRSQAAVDDRAGAVRSWQRAVIIADDLGARSEAQLLGQLLRSIGVRRMPTTSGEGVGSPVANLTAREREVAAQAARGRRNAEIAAALFVSTKTVERHLSSIFAKLQVRSRGELAARYGSLVAGPTMSDSPR